MVRNAGALNTRDTECVVGLSEALGGMRPAGVEVDLLLRSAPRSGPSSLRP